MKKPAEKNNPENPALTELVNDLQRTRADFENFRKNVEKDRENAKKLASYSTVLKFLPLLDDLDRAIATYEELKPLAKNFEKSLKNLGLEKIDTSEGAEFNPELHDAVMSEGDGTKETIAETLRPGYLYGGEVIRPAMVKIKLM
ncbi:nucleotide exchange factor GrpE [Candidatus Saccharibacteria bacterium]|nr:nucleotide exchange factor GrpE [Candidatus Saccharibacteria bacterium]MBR6122504.1 nucleotide exchange factor GrpE [Candidatus Saccharibacteria bacterium]